MWLLVLTFCTLGASMSISSPAQYDHFTPGSTIPISWNYVNTDPSTFSLYLVNFSSDPSYTHLLARDVSTSAQGYSARIPTNVTPRPGFQINAVKGTNANQIYAQSQQFEIAAAEQKRDTEIWNVESVDLNENEIPSIYVNSVKDEKRDTETWNIESVDLNEKDIQSAYAESMKNIKRDMDTWTIKSVDASENDIQSAYADSMENVKRDMDTWTINSVDANDAQSNYDSSMRYGKRKNSDSTMMEYANEEGMTMYETTV